MKNQSQRKLKVARRELKTTQDLKVAKCARVSRQAIHPWFPPYNLSNKQNGQHQQESKSTEMGLKWIKWKLSEDLHSLVIHFLPKSSSQKGPVIFAQPGVASSVAGLCSIF
jgi:hypothetical protein